MTEQDYKKIFDELFARIGVKEGGELSYSVLTEDGYIYVDYGPNGEDDGIERTTKDWRFADNYTYMEDTAKWYADHERKTGETFKFVPAPGVILEGITEDKENGFSHEGHEDLWYRGDGILKRMDGTIINTNAVYNF